MKSRRFLSRRDFFLLSGAGSVLLNQASYGAKFVAQQTVGVRREFNELYSEWLKDKKKPNDFTKFVGAVAKLKALKSGNKTHWEILSAIHSEHCKHKSWYFLPWHRAYIAFFEHVCRHVLRDDTFMLPYWDWSGHPEIPKAILKMNVLEAKRKLDNRVADPAKVNGVLERVLTIRDPVVVVGAESKMGQIEAPPHNYVHEVLFGGDMNSRDAPKDPIFWLHHANVDRIWSHWYSKFNTIPCDFYKLKIDNFSNTEQLTHGKPFSLGTSTEVKTLLDTTNNLGYDYKDVSTSISTVSCRAIPTEVPLGFYMQFDFSDSQVKPDEFVIADFGAATRGLDESGRQALNQFLADPDSKTTFRLTLVVEKPNVYMQNSTVLLFWGGLNGRKLTSDDNEFMGSFNFLEFAKKKYKYFSSRKRRKWFSSGHNIFSKKRDGGKRKCQP